MVKRLFILSFLGLAACSPGKWWGEEAPPPKVVSAPVNASNCPPAEKLLNGTEEESALAMACLEADVSDAWKKVRGSEQDRLRLREVDALVQSGVIDLSKGDRTLSRKKIHSLKKLLGLNRDVSRADTNDLLKWIKDHRGDLRHTYLKFSNKENLIQYKDIRTAMGLVSSFLRSRKVHLDKEELGRTLQILIDDGKPSSVLPEASLVLHDVLGALCPGHAESKAWDGQGLADCLDVLADDFASGEEWINFMLDQRADAYTQSVHDSMRIFSFMVERRVNLQGLDGLHPELWVNLAAKMKAKPPASFLKSLDAIKAFEPQSNGKFLHPRIINVIFRVIEDMHSNLLKALPAYEIALRDGLCVNGKVKKWRDCVLPDKLIADNESLKVIQRVSSRHFGSKASPVTGKRFKKILLFQAVANEMVRAFDKDGDGIISTDQPQQDELTSLLGVAMSSVDSVSTFINNMKDRANGIELKEQGDVNTFDHLNVEGVARLVTLVGSDLLVVRSKEERMILRKIFDNIFNSFPGHSLQVDRDGLVAILSFVDTFGDYRDAYIAGEEGDKPILSKEHEKFDKLLIDRPAALAALPRILRVHFPRTYDSCMVYGFQRSCGIALDEILPLADPGGDWTSAKDLDMLTLVAGSLESLMDSCDYNDNGALSYNLIDGNDELDCAVSKIANIVKRMMESKLVRVKNPEATKLILNGMNSIFLTRTFAKTALIYGTADGAVLGPLKSLGKEATLGSIYALMSEILAKDRVEALKKETR